MSALASGGAMDIASVLAPLTNLIGDLEKGYGFPTLLKFKRNNLRR